MADWSDKRTFLARIRFQFPGRIFASIPSQRTSKALAAENNLGTRSTTGETGSCAPRIRRCTRSFFLNVTWNEILFFPWPRAREDWCQAVRQFFESVRLKPGARFVRA